MVPGSRDGEVNCTGPDYRWAVKEDKARLKQDMQWLFRHEVEFGTTRRGILDSQVPRGVSSANTNGNDQQQHRSGRRNQPGAGKIRERKLRFRQEESTIRQRCEERVLEFFDWFFAEQQPIKKFKKYSKKLHYPSDSPGDQPLIKRLWARDWCFCALFSTTDCTVKTQGLPKKHQVPWTISHHLTERQNGYLQSGHLREVVAYEI